MTVDAAQLLSALSDPLRLSVLATLANHGPMDLAGLSEWLGCTPRYAGTAVGQLVDLRLISRAGRTFAAELDVLRDAAAELDATHPVTALLADYPRLRGCFSHGRLVNMPDLAEHGSDLAALLARVIAVTGPVDEAEVNRRLRIVSDDPAQLRRLLCDEGVLLRHRDGSTYRPASPRS
jgi:hypothetical protein